MSIFNSDTGTYSEPVLVADSNAQLIAYNGNSPYIGFLTPGSNSGSYQLNWNEISLENGTIASSGNALIPYGLFDMNAVESFSFDSEAGKYEFNTRTYDRPELWTVVNAPIVDANASFENVKIIRSIENNGFTVSQQFGFEGGGAIAIPDGVSIDLGSGLLPTTGADFTIVGNLRQEVRIDNYKVNNNPVYKKFSKEFEKTAENTTDILENDVHAYAIGEILGSSLGRAIAGDNQFAQIAVGTSARRGILPRCNVSVSRPRLIIQANATKHMKLQKQFRQKCHA